MFGLLRAKPIENTYDFANGAVKHSRLGPEEVRRSPAQTDARYDANHIRHAASKKIARSGDSYVPQEVQGAVVTDDLHCDAPIAISVRHRALPLRFADAEEIASGFFARCIS